MNTVAITGATSMLGIALIQKCIRENINVIALCRKNSVRKDYIPKSPLVKIFECDLNNLTNFDFGLEKADVLFHLGWSGTTRNTRNDPLEQCLNIKYSLDAVELAKKLGCKKYVFAGSQAEFGPSSAVLTESSPCNPTTPYGVSKLAAGKLTKIKCNQYDIVHIWVRIFSVFGVHQNKDTLIDYSVSHFLKNESTTFSSGRNNWNFIYEVDAGNILYYLGDLITHDDVFCMGNFENKTLKEYILTMRDLCNSSSKCVFGEGIGQQLIVDPSKLFRAINYQLEFSFEDGIRDLISYFYLDDWGTK